jgi:hypothetical protein
MFTALGHDAPRRSLVAAAALLVMPWLLLAINDSWAFLGAYAASDPYFYTGLFVHFPDHLREFEGTYYVTRLPHIFLGALVYAVFELPWSSYVLRVTYWYLAVFSLYGMLNRIVRSSTAAYVSCVVFGTSVYFLWSIGWDYVDGAALTFFLASGFFLTRLDLNRRSLIAAGMLQVFAATTYLLVALLIPLQLAYVALFRLRHERPIGSLAWTVPGWLAGFAVLGTLNVTFDGRFNFLRPQISAVTAFSSDRALYKAPTYDWVASATWLTLIVVATVCALAIVATTLRRCGANGRRLVKEEGFGEAAVLLAALLAFAGSEVAGYYLLQISYYSNYLLPFALTMIGVVIAQALRDTSSTRQIALASLVTLTAIVPFEATLATRYPHCAPWCQALPYALWIFVPMIVLFGAAAVRRQFWSVSAAVLGLTLSNVAMADTRIFAFPADSAKRQQYATIIEASRRVAKQFPRRPVRFWYDFNESPGLMYRSIAATYMWNWSLVGEAFPTLKRPATDTESILAPGDAIVVLTSRPQGDALAAVEQQGLSPRLLSATTLVSGGIAFNLFAIEPTITGAATSEVPLAEVKAQDGSVKADRRELTIITAPLPYAYAAKVDLRPFMRSAPQTASLAFDIARARETIGLCVLDVARRDCVARRTVDDRMNGTTVYLRIPDISQVSDLIVQSWAAGDSGELSLTSIRVIQ